MSPENGQSSSRVLIIGGGLGGLALAHGLKKSSTPFQVFEQDPTPDFRAQGYRLKINEDGAAALKSALSPEMWQYFEETCTDSKAGETNFNAIDGSIIASRAGPGARGGMKTWTTDRTVLRRILQEGLKGDISYGKQLKKYTITDNGVIAEFTDGSTEDGVLIVGADGVRSAVRRQYLPEHKPLDTNGSCIYGKTPLTPELKERFPERAVKWMTLVLDRTPMTQTLDVDETPLTLLLEPVRFQNNEHRSKLPVDYIYWVLIARTAVFGRDRDELLRLNHEESARLSLSLTDEWHPSFKALFELQDISQASTLRVASANPNIALWEPSSRVTLIGDAIHVMSPTGGVGAVTAIRDAALLSSIISEQGVTAAGIAEYESEMRIYAKMAIQRSFFGGKKMFAQRPFEECEELEM
ncbi:MAG: hypothetical protein ASARMPREDX12_002167 [Alectoria sarmentosa]|nr:MAG: hypothetical protein ASARMPREDX12_002167 [Alectoria sarmentosa]